MDVTRLSATELAPLIRSREVSAREVTEATLQRCDELATSVNAFITVDAEGALRAASAADDAAASGQWTGPLHGIAFTVKDLLPTAGVRTTYGSRAFIDHMPDRDAIAVTRVRDAGGILIGKTATPELAASLQTMSALNGITRNPWKLDRSAGGSSGGAGAAIASGQAPLALSTDGAGSARVPASVCGVLGLKPTLGRVPHEAWPFHYSNNSSVSLNTRSAADASLLLGVIEGATRADPWASRPAAQSAGELGGSVLLIERPSGLDVDPDIGAVVHGVLDALGLDVTSSDGDPTEFDPAMVPGILAPNLAARVRALSEAERADLEAPLQALASPDYRPDAVELQQLEIERSRLYDRVDRLLQTHSVILTPTVLADPPAADAVIDPEWWTHLAVANFTGHPAISIPCGFSAAGLPVGLQAVGRWDADHELIELARRVHDHHPWTKRWPTG